MTVKIHSLKCISLNFMILLDVKVYLFILFILILVINSPSDSDVP